MIYRNDNIVADNLTPSCPRALRDLHSAAPVVPAEPTVVGVFVYSLPTRTFSRRSFIFLFFVLFFSFLLVVFLTPALCFGFVRRFCFRFGTRYDCFGSRFVPSRVQLERTKTSRTSFAVAVYGFFADSESFNYVAAVVITVRNDQRKNPIGGNWRNLSSYRQPFSQTTRILTHFDRQYL